MSQIKCELVAKVIVAPNRKNTTVIIDFGPFPIATRTIGGVWNPVQALAEFKKCPSRFTFKDEQAKSICKSLGINPDPVVSKKKV